MKESEPNSLVKSSGSIFEYSLSSVSIIATFELTRPFKVSIFEVVERLDKCIDINKNMLGCALRIPRRNNGSSFRLIPTKRAVALHALIDIKSFFTVLFLLFTKTAAVQSEVALSYHKVRGL